MISSDCKVRFKKYYKSLFLGFVDLAIINALIVFNRARAAANKTMLSHVAFLKQLHLELCQVSVADWEELLRTQGQNFTPTKQRIKVSKHMPVLTEDTRKGDVDGSKKRRQEPAKSALS
uniref:PiggyBac transposable element-derived protein domain-containing protein n=1 Tax=Phytophthora ramorum TaxID=164328 RepID=H3GN00_PHYRM